MRFLHPEKTPSLVYANRHGEIKNLPGLHMAGRSGNFFFRPAAAELIPLPEGSELFLLPDRMPVGISPENDDPVLLDHDPDNPGETVQAVAAFMAPAHTAIHSAAYEQTRDDLAPLPLFAYTAVGWLDGKFWVSAFRSDPDRRQDIRQFDQEKMTTDEAMFYLGSSYNKLRIC